MRYISLLLTLLLLASFLLTACTDNDTEQSKAPANTAVSQTVVAESDIPTSSDSDPMPEPTRPVPTELETQTDVVIDVPGTPVIGG